MENKVIIYGGAFNPPTVAHQAIAQAAAEWADNQNAELWILPSGDRADKELSVPIEKRLSYAHGLLASLSTSITTQVCDIEIKSNNLTQTSQTVRALEKKHPKTSFTWIFGSDSVNAMTNWNEGDWLLNHLQMLVVQRPGFLLSATGSNIVVLPVDQIHTSSTEVRSRHEKGLSVAELVPAPVLSLL